MKTLGYYLGQVPQFGAALLGVIPIAVACYFRAYGFHGATSNKVWPAPYQHFNGRPIDTWCWDWMNAWWGNPEDGVSGTQALVWKDASTLVYYNPTNSRWKAFVWSAWRNSADALKYRFPQA
jgi:hypothetical protein